MSGKPTYEELEQRIRALENKALKQAQTDGALLESEEMFRLAFENANIGMCLVDTEGRIAKVNAEMMNIFGYSQKELEGMTVNDIAHPEDLDISPAFIKRASSGEITHSEFEKRYIHQNGHTVWGQVVSSFVQNPKGRMPYFISHVKDISEYKQAEEALRKTEHEKEAILDSLLEFVVYLDPEMKILWANQAACESVDLARNKLIGRHCFELWADRSEPCIECAVVKAMKTGKAQEIEKTTPDGRFWFNRGYPIRDEKNNIIGGIEVALEITERKQAEEALRASERNYREIFDATNDGIIVHDMATGKIVDVNSKLCELLGYSFEEVMDLTVQDISYGKPPYTENEAMQWIKKAIEDGPQLFEWLARKSSGELIWLEINLKRAVIGGKDRVLAVDRDISERKQAEASLKQSEEKYRLLVNNLPGTVYIGYRDWSVEFYDNRVEELTGYNMHQFNSGKMKWLDLVVKADVEPAKQIFIKALKTDKSYVRDYKLKTKAGNIIWIQERGYIVCNQDGDIEYVSGVFYDITDLKSAEEELKTSRALLHSTIESLPFDFFAMGQDGRYILQNSAGKERWGKLIGKRPEDLSVKSETLASWLEANRQAFSGETVKGEVQYVLEGKQEIHHSIVAPIVSEGEVLGILGANIDITTRKLAEKVIKESEERYRSLYQESSQREQLYESLLNATPDAVAIYNLNGETIFINPAFTRIFGFTMEDVQGKRIPFVPESEMDKTKAGIEKVLSGKPVTGFETHRITKDGRILDASLSSSCYYDHQGNVAGILVFLRDVTDAKHIEKQLLHYNKMEAVGTLAGGIAHDFNNLLQAIQGYAEILLLDRDIIESGHRELQHISQAAKRGGELTRQLLTFSRKVESKKLLIDLNREVKQAQRILQRTIPKMIDIELGLKEPLKTINADPTQVEQVIMNLAINAKDAMPEGGRLIIRTKNATLDEEYCRAHPGSTPGDYVLLTVSDTGYGMDRETQEHLFEPFFTTKELGRGTGLGLAIVYGIVKSHHGYIACHSKLDEGTVFKVYFPAVEQAPEPAEQETKVPIKGGTETILLVDDEKYIRDLAKQMLEQFGYKVLTAVDGESALGLYRKEQDRIHLVILDLIMPGMGGKQCLAEMLKLNAQAKVIIISGYSDTIPIQETIETGAKNFIAKPFDIRRMLDKVRDVLDE